MSAKCKTTFASLYLRFQTVSPSKRRFSVVFSVFFGQNDRFFFWPFFFLTNSAIAQTPLVIPKGPSAILRTPPRSVLFFLTGEACVVSNGPFGGPRLSHAHGRWHCRGRIIACGTAHPAHVQRRDPRVGQGGALFCDIAPPCLPAWGHTCSATWRRRSTQHVCPPPPSPFLWSALPQVCKCCITVCLFFHHHNPINELGLKPPPLSPHTPPPPSHTTCNLALYAVPAGACPQTLLQFTRRVSRVP